MTDSLGTIIGILAMFVIAGTAWWVLTIILPLGRDDARARRWFWIGLQVNLVLIYFAWLVRPGGIFWGVIAPWYPPLAFITFGREGFFSVARVLAVPFIAGLVAAAAVLVVGLLVRRLRLFAPGLAAVVGMTVIALQAPGYAAARIEERARELGASCLAQTSLWQSRRFAGDAPQFHLHAVAQIGGAWHGWSYAKGDFYEIPDRVKIETLPLVADCAPL